MQKVVTINLNGRAYQLDEDAYEALRAYLQRAEAQLRDNLDRAEIIGDIEQAIADKCERCLSPHKTVVIAAEIAQILGDMGPVDSGHAEDPTAAATEPDANAGAPPQEKDAPRRLYRVWDGSLVGGVCTGLAAYLDLDVTLVRVAFVVVVLVDLSLLHTPIAVLAYFAMMFLLPEAHTSEERAAASGAPFNAHEIIAQAKRNYAAFRSATFNDNTWRHQKRAWKRQRRQWRRRAWDHRPWGRDLHYAPAGYAARVGAGALMPVLTLINVVVFWVGLFVVLSLLQTGAVHGRRLPEGTPVWVGVIVVVLVCNAIGWPIHAARRASYYVLGGAYHGWFEAWDGLLSLLLAATIVWAGYHYVPEVRDLVQHLPDVWNTLRHLPDTWRTLGQSPTT